MTDCNVEYEKRGWGGGRKEGRKEADVYQPLNRIDPAGFEKITFSLKEFILRLIEDCSTTLLSREKKNDLTQKQNWGTIDVHSELNQDSKQNTVHTETLMDSAKWVASDSMLRI